ncbi:beta strand repeat-containing protein [Aurantibacter sp.]|uniref:beta strand repeat-containing protein n=1 Tax=Aurantibacter sp. TaxID=2807103 RepID=UPI0035C84488
MDIKNKILVLSTLLLTLGAFGQVGIGNTSPQATLDISASNQATPSNEDGILIPRIDTFPATNPTVTQDAMIVYLTTTDGTDAPGFYYWNNATTNWLPFGGASSGWEITGNAGTLSGTNFLGTRDNQALDVRTNNVIRARFTTDSKLEILNSGNSVYIGENAGAADPTTVAKENVMIGTNAGQDITTGASSAFEGAYNTGVGFNALASQTTGNRNTVVGNNAASNTTTGNFNVAVGQDALLNAVSASYNTALGQDAIENVQGDRNTAVGYRALAGKQNATIGSATRNTVVGTQAGLRVQDATNNVWLGDDVDQFNNDGIQNTIVGSQAGASFGSARDLNGRVLIGYQAGSTFGGADNTLYIENSDSETPLIYGEFDNDIVRIGGQLQIGRSDGTVGSIYAFPTVDGTTGQVLTTDGSGNVTWQNGGSGASADADWFAQGTTAAPTAITDNIFTNGNVGIGDTTPDAELDIEAATGDATLIITADPTNTNEENNPVITLVQDGGGVTGQIEMGSNTLSPNDLVISTSNTNSDILFRPENTNSVAFQTDGQVRLHQYATTTSFTGTATSILAVDANGRIIQEAIPGSINAWELTGNSGTTSGTNFLGTTDNQALDVSTNNVIRARFTTDSKLEILNSGNSVYIGENAGAADPTTVAKENVMIGTNAGQDITTGASSAFEGAYNTGVGFNALASQTTGNRNTVVGNNAASNTTTGNFNVAVGQDALLNAVSASYNTALGQDAIENVQGDRNTAVGYRALAGKQNATIGSATRNTVVGTQAGLRVQDATNNVWLGDDVDQFNNNGIQNTIIGSQAGASFGSARDLNGRVLIGYQAGSTLGGADNTLYIENSDSETPLIGGDFANNRLGVNVDMSTTANLTHTLTVGGSVKINTLMNLTPGTAPATPAEGDVYYDSATKKVRVWTGAAWENLN